MLLLPFLLALASISCAAIYRPKHELTEFNEVFVQLAGPSSFDALNNVNKKRNSSESPVSVVSVNQLCNDSNRQKRKKIENETNNNDQTVHDTSGNDSNILSLPQQSASPDADYFIKRGMHFHPDYIPTSLTAGLYRQPELLVEADTSIQSALESYRFELYAASVLQSTNKMMR